MKTLQTKHAVLVGLVALLMMSTTGWAQLITTDPTLPPGPNGQYVSPDDYHTYLAIGIVLDDPSHDRFTNVVRTPLGPDELESFDSYFSAVEVNLGLGPIILTGPVQVITFGKVGNTTGTFDTEILSMDLVSLGPGPFGPPIQVRIDPNPLRPSLGVTTITDLGSGLYQIDSFFDVFTELSPDGGTNWIPSDSFTRMTLTPEPATMSLLAIGALALIRRRRK